MGEWAPHASRELEQTLTTLAHDAPGRWSFAVREGGSAIALVEADRSVVPASTIKVAVMVLVLRDVASGALDWNQTLRIPSERAGGSGVLVSMPSVQELTVAEITELMITVSDNEATNILIRLLGLSGLDERLAGLGMTDTHLQRTLMHTHLPGRNLTTAADQAFLLDRLCADLLAPEQRQIALDILDRQQFTSRIPARMGEDVNVRHKTGSIEGIRHDVGILEFDARQISFAALGTDLAEATKTAGDGPIDDVIARAAQLVVQAARA